MKLSDENKKVSEFNDSQWFGYGVHKVQLGLFELGGTEEGEKEYIEITVMDPEDGEITDTARVWFTTEAAANYSFNALRQIYVHNAPEKAKDAARDTFDAIPDTEKLVELLNEKLIGKEAWFTKYPSPTRTYVNQTGETKKSIDKNVLGYEPKLKPELLPKTDEVIDDIDIDKPITAADLGGEEAKGDAAAGIPKGW
jgi:hypothetical protein